MCSTGTVSKVTNVNIVTNILDCDKCDHYEKVYHCDKSDHHCEKMWTLWKNVTIIVTDSTTVTIMTIMKKYIIVTKVTIVTNVTIASDHCDKYNISPWP